MFVWSLAILEGVLASETVNKIVLSCVCEFAVALFVTFVIHILMCVHSFTPTQ